MITYEDCKDIEISLSKPYGNAIINLDIKPDELAWILNECVKSGVVSSTKVGIKMTGTELRWSTIDGKTWTASCNGIKYAIDLSEIPGLSDSYVLASFDVNYKSAWDFEGQFSTLAEAKAEAERKVA